MAPPTQASSSHHGWRNTGYGVLGVLVLLIVAACVCEFIEWPFLRHPLESKVSQILDRPVSLLLDADGRMLRGKCSCSHHFTGGLRKGPCRPLQALRDHASARPGPSTLDAWFAALDV